MSRISLMDYLDLCILHGRDGEVTTLCSRTENGGSESLGRFSCYPHCVYSFYVLYISEFTNLDITISNLFTVLI